MYVQLRKKLKVYRLNYRFSFHDDNTYTNKTWAEVSGISVQEVHIMEVEFLSNMRYSLMVYPHQMQAWLKQVEDLQEYLRRPVPQPVRVVELMNVSPSFQILPRPQPTTRGNPCGDSAHDTGVSSCFYPQLCVSDSEDENYSASGTEASSSEFWSDEDADFERHNVRHEETNFLPSASSKDAIMLDLDLGTEDIVEFSTQLPAGNVQMSPSDDNTDISKEDSERLDTDHDLLFGQDIMLDPSDIRFPRSNVDILMDLDSPDTFPNLWQTQSLQNLLSMELPMPLFDPEDAHLQWESIMSSALQDGPIPELDSCHGSSSLWGDDPAMSGLIWKILPDVEEASTLTVAPDAVARFEELDLSEP
jgi:hypothetical protein